MLIGGQNTVNEKLVDEISQVLPISFKNFQELLEGEGIPEFDNSHFIILNLMDIGMEEDSIFRMVKERYPRKKIIALHCFQVDSLIQSTLKRGYDYYISILNFSEEFQMLLEDNIELYQR